MFKVGDKFVIEISEVIETGYYITKNGIELSEKELEKLPRAYDDQN